MDLFIPTLSQGLLWSILALGVYLTFRVLDIADLTVEGSFPLGAAVAARLLSDGSSPFSAIFAACAAGMLAGVVTGWLTTKLKIPALLSGILTMIALYSVNLRVMGKANLSLLRQETIFTRFEAFFDDRQFVILAVGFAAVLFLSLLFYWFFGTEIGAAIRATGFNPHMIRANGVNTDVTVILGLLLSNGLVAISGALIAQSNGFADVGMGVGTIVIVGEVLFGSNGFMKALFGSNGFLICLVSVILGSIVYRAVIALVLELGMPPNDLKLFTALLVAIALALPLIHWKLLQERKAVK